MYVEKYKGQMYDKCKKNASVKTGLIIEVKFKDFERQYALK